MLKLWTFFATCQVFTPNNHQMSVFSKESLPQMQSFEKLHHLCMYQREMTDMQGDNSHIIIRGLFLLSCQLSFCLFKL